MLPGFIFQNYAIYLIYTMLPLSVLGTYCGIGYFPPGLNKPCEQCPFGTIREKYASDDLNCTTCPIGKSSQFYGISVDLDNDAPTDENSKWYTHNCFPCPWMWAKPDPTALRCSRCSAGTESLDNRTACSMCPAGKFNAGGDSSSCFTCKPGQYTATTGNKACLTCPVGKTTSIWGSTRCDSCPVGKAGYISGATDPYCKVCSSPFYSHETGLAGCKKCSAGSITNKSAPSSCTICPAGTWQKSTLNDVCVPCPSIPYGAAASVCPEYKHLDTVKTDAIVSTPAPTPTDAIVSTPAPTLILPLPDRYNIIATTQNSSAARCVVGLLVLVISPLVLTTIQNTQG